MQARPALDISTGSWLSPLQLAAAFLARRGKGLAAAIVGRHHDTHELARLSQRQLADIGLTKHDVMSIDDQLPWYDPLNVEMRRR